MSVVPQSHISLAVLVVPPQPLWRRPPGYPDQNSCAAGGRNYRSRPAALASGGCPAGKRAAGSGSRSTARSLSSGSNRGFSTAPRAGNSRRSPFFRLTRRPQRLSKCSTSFQASMMLSRRTPGAPGLLESIAPPLPEASPVGVTMPWPKRVAKWGKNHLCNLLFLAAEGRPARLFEDDIQNAGESPGHQLPAWFPGCGRD